MEFKRYTSVSQPNWKLGWNLYQTAFPLHEQRLPQHQEAAMAQPDYHCDLIFEDEQFIGLIFYWVYGENCCHIEHFAIDSALRGKRMGSKCLEQFCKSFSAVILEIDPPVDHVSIHRQGFYERLGFQAKDYGHIHPSYRKDCSPHPLLIMSYPYLINQEEYDTFYRFLKNRMMVFSERPPL